MSGNLAVLPSPAVPAPREPRIFRVFISYASEDKSIALAMAKCLTVALGDFFAEVYLDKGFLLPGDNFKTDIESRLQKTDVLIIVYTGVKKESHGYTGWEVGYFDHVMQTAPDKDKKKIAMYLDKPPDISADEQGISLNIGRDKLQTTLSEFESGITVQPDDPLCRLIEKWQEEVAEITRKAGFPKREQKPEQNPVTCVKNLQLEIFRYLKTTVDITLKPQKQLTIKAKGSALQRSESDLPPDAELVPVGSGAPMAIFGLPDVPTTWEKFLQTIDESRRDSWRDAIASVVLSSFPNKIDVDNSQVIVASDEKAYRIILTTATRYYDDNREFNLYFVEGLRRSAYGDEASTLLLEGLELVCRFRFLFLEANSEFCYKSIQMMPPARMPEVVSRLRKELNLLRKDSRDAGLDQPHMWAQFVSWEHLQKMAADYGPREIQIRSVVSRILEAKGQLDRIIPLRQELSDVLQDLGKTIGPETSLLLREMAGKLQEMTEKAGS